MNFLVGETIKSNLPYRVVTKMFLAEVENSDAYRWCREQFGPEMFVAPDEDTEGSYILNKDSVWDFYGSAPAKFYFRNEDDALVFKLTWGGE